MRNPEPSTTPREITVNRTNNPSRKRMFDTIKKEIKEFFESPDEKATKNLYKACALFGVLLILLFISRQHNGLATLLVVLSLGCLCIICWHFMYNSKVKEIVYIPAVLGLISIALTANLYGLGDFKKWGQNSPNDSANKVQITADTIRLKLNVQIDSTHRP